MANGDIVKFGRWKLTRKDGSYVYDTYHDTFVTLDYQSYNKIELTYENNASYDQLEWIEYGINRQKIYISKNCGFKYISYNEALSYCNGDTITINNIKYKFMLLSREDWANTGTSIAGKTYLDNSLILTNTIVDGYVRPVFRSSNSFNNGGILFTTEKSSGICYVPVLLRINAAPIISGEDTDLGNKTSSFSISYSVSDEDSGQELTVTEKLNGNIIRTLQNPTQNSTLTFTITDGLFSSLSMGTTNTIEIEVTDGSATTYRRYTFIKTNSAPLINYSGQLDLGQLTSKPSISYSVSDNEGDTITVTEKLNGEVIRQFTATSNTNYTITLTDEFWLTCGKNTNTIEISASDVNGGTSYKYITFTRQVNKVQITTKNAIETDVAATKIMVSPDWDKTGCTGKVEVCNNGFDASPTWEDMTTMAALNRPYVFTNKTKTAAKWGIKIRLTLTKNEGYEGEVAIYGFGGAFE